MWELSALLSAMELSDSHDCLRAKKNPSRYLTTQGCLCEPSLRSHRSIILPHPVSYSVIIKKERKGIMLLRWRNCYSLLDKAYSGRLLEEASLIEATTAKNKEREIPTRSTSTPHSITSRNISRLTSPRSHWGQDRTQCKMIWMSTLRIPHSKLYTVSYCRGGSTSLRRRNFLRSLFRRSDYDSYYKFITQFGLILGDGRSKCLLGSKS